MTITENICPNCKESNELEAIVCVHCGAILEDPFLDPGARTKTKNMPAVVPENLKDWPVDDATVPHNGIAVYIEGEFHPVYRGASAEIVIGRKAGATGSVTDDLLDLSAQGGYARGLSRRHAVIRRAEQGYEILDLGSVNGTWLNNERLTPQKFYPMSSGSHLRLGGMRLYVLYNTLKATKS